MKKKSLGAIFVIIIILILSIPNKTFAVTATNEYEIQSYNIDMIVNENNTFDITETITAYFKVSKHGIYRKIPLKNSITRIDGTKSNNRAKITNIKVNENYTTSNENGYKVIKIGNANSTLKGMHTYTIKYTYNIGKDPLKNADELYYNLIGDQWDTKINNISFSITMPKPFDKSLLGFSSGNVGSTNSSNVIYSVNGNTITGNATNTLSAGQALTIRLTLPDGYFVGASTNIDKYSILIMLVCAIFVLIADRLWAKYGKDDIVIETVEFYPPEGYNSAEIGFLYKGEADTKSIISLLIYLADKGYLEISKNEGKGIFLKSKGFKITKLKEYDGNNEYERIFFNGLFSCSKGTLIKASDLMKKNKRLSWEEAKEIVNANDDTKRSVTASDLYDNFYRTLNRIKSKINSKENKNKIFESYASRQIKWLIMMIITIFVLITARPVLEYGEKEILLFALVFPGIGFTVLIGALIGAIKMPKIFAITWGGMFGGMPWVFIVLPTLTQNMMYFVMYIVGIICIAAILLFIKIMPRRTPYGNEILGKIKGFKRFLETAEKTQLESLVVQNPEYFYNILPYTYALGVSNVWINQFEAIALKAPNWYNSTDNFNIHTFGTFMNTTMTSATFAMCSSPSSNSGGSSGGSSSGGGSSGGGSGGGGGGSW